MRLGRLLTHREASADGCQLLRAGLDLYGKLIARSPEMALTEGEQKYWEVAIVPCGR